MKCPNCEEGSFSLCDVCDRPRWIKCSERMPKPPSPMDDHKELKHLITDGKMICTATFVYWPPWTWVLPRGMEKVTHWMDLPTVPCEILTYRNNL